MRANGTRQQIKLTRKPEITLAGGVATYEASLDLEAVFVAAQDAAMHISHTP